MAQEKTFIEQMVKRGDKKKDMMQRLLIVIVALLVMSIPFILGVQAIFYAAPVLLMVIALTVWIMWRRAAQEFEYIYTEGHVDIDVIFGRTSRKPLYAGDLKQCQFFGPATDEQTIRKIQTLPIEKTVNACNARPGEGAYAMVGKYKEKTLLIYWEPDARILKLIKNYTKYAVIRDEDMVEKEMEGSMLVSRTGTENEDIMADARKQARMDARTKRELARQEAYLKKEKARMEKEADEEDEEAFLN